MGQFSDVFGKPKRDEAYRDESDPPRREARGQHCDGSELRIAIVPRPMRYVDRQLEVRCLVRRELWRGIGEIQRGNNPECMKPVTLIASHNCPASITRIDSVRPRGNWRGR